LIGALIAPPTIINIPLAIAAVADSPAIASVTASAMN
jgi:hypothetical protein